MLLFIKLLELSQSIQMDSKKIKNALLSVFYKDKLEKIAKSLEKLDVNIYSTGGTYDFIKKLGINAQTVESLTSYPSILGGRVKTLHPKVFGGILGRRDNDEDLRQLNSYGIPEFDLVIVDLYPFEETVISKATDQEIIEKIDIGGISLIRAAAKNFKDVLVVPSSAYYDELIRLLDVKQGVTTLEDRKLFATYAFHISSHYDMAIFNYFNDINLSVFKQSIQHSHKLRYGENPHQEGLFFGKLDDVFEQLHGKAISFNNLVDIDAAIHLINEFSEPTFAILKHTNTCGAASRDKLADAWKDALAGDPVSAFGGVLVTNQIIDKETSAGINKIFFEVILAPGYEEAALETLKSKKNRIILQSKSCDFPHNHFKSILNGIIQQEKDEKPLTIGEIKVVTKTAPKENEKLDLLFANIIVKHTKSNAIVLAKNKQLVASGIGQTSRVDALKQAIEKAKSFGFDLKGAVMASDAFFPFADSVEIAHKEGITAVIQPGGSIRDQDSIDYCNQHGLSMVFTGTRHFKH